MKTAISVCGWAALVGGLILLAGLLIEARVAFLHFPYDSPWEIGGQVLVAFGVGVELLFSHLGSSAQSELLRRAEGKLTKATAELAELAERLEPRGFVQEQINRIVEKVKPFPDTPFDIAIDPTIEWNLAETIASILSFGAGWKWRKYPGAVTGAPAVGIIIARRGLQLRVNKGRIADFEAPAMALADALSTEGFTTHIAFDAPEHPAACASDAIHIEIGRKP